MKTLALIALSLTTVACSMQYNPRYYYNEVQAVNRTADTITNVSIRIPGSPKEWDCESVNNNAMCADRFGKRVYPQNGIEVSWDHPDGTRKTNIDAPSVPVTFPKAFPIRIVMIIDEEGVVDTFYEQDEPDHNRILD